MIEQIINTLSSIITSETIVKIIYILFILLGGFVLANLIRNIFIKLLKYLGIKRPNRDRRIKQTLRFIYVSIIMLSLLAASAVVGIGVGQELAVQALQFLPNLLISGVFFFGGILFIDAFVDVMKEFTHEVRLEDYLEEIGASNIIINGIVVVFKYFLYLILLQIILTQLGIPTSVLESILSSIGYGVVFLISLLLFFSFKDILVNAVAGYIMRTSSMLSIGQEIKTDQGSGTIEKIGAINTRISSKEGYQLIIPNSQILKKPVIAKKSHIKLKELKEILKHYVAQDPSYCGPASTSMALSIFGYDISQNKIAKIADTKVPGGNEPQELIMAVRNMTEDEVLGTLVQHKKIANLKTEIKSWLSDGGLILLNFYKSKIMPWTKRGGHYALCVGVEGDDLLVLDPNAVEGGVYLVNYKEMEEAMKEYDKERGYTVLAPKGTAAYTRITDGIIYADPTLYEKLTRDLSAKLLTLSYKAKEDSVFSHFLKKINNNNGGKNESVTRLWKK